MRTVPMLTVVAILLARGRLKGQAAAGDEARERAVVEKYLHGLKFNDTTSLREAFRPEALLYYIKNDTLAHWTQKSWYATFAGHIGQEEKGDLRIASVDVIRDMASAKVVEDY